MVDVNYVGLTVSYFFLFREILNFTKQGAVSLSFDRFAKLKKVRKYAKKVFRVGKNRFVS